MSPDLLSAQKAFSDFKRTSRNSREKYPPDLCKQAIALLSQHRPHLVAKVLGISQSSLSKWGKEHRKSTKQVEKKSPTPSELALTSKVSFIDVSAAVMMPMDRTPGASATIDHPRYGRLSFSGLNADTTQAIVRQFLAGEGAVR